jgi:hypothetical protein
LPPRPAPLAQALQAAQKARVRLGPGAGGGNQEEVSDLRTCGIRRKLANIRVRILSRLLAPREGLSSRRCTYARPPCEYCPFKAIMRMNGPTYCARQQPGRCWCATVLLACTASFVSASLNGKVSDRSHMAIQCM